MRRAAEIAIEAFRKLLQYVSAVDVFEKMMQIGATLPGTDGDGVDAEAVCRNVMALFQRAT